MIIMYKPNEAARMNYCHYNIPELAMCIVENSDTRAIDELSARVICIKNGNELNLPRYLESLKESKRPGLYESVMIKEKAYDMAIARFYNIPENSNGGPDCRCYYRAFLNYLMPIISGKDFVQQDVIAANKLKCLVKKHFEWSLRDAKRRESGFSRAYQWNTQKRSLRLQMPTCVNGHQCLEWLKNNIGEPDFERLYEKERIQQIIDDTLFTPSNISLCSASFRDFKAQSSTPLTQLIEDEMTAKPLSECIANEKSDNLNILRASIARIGKKKVKELVIAIFDAINTDTYKPSLLGAEFGISPAAMTRFASLKWSGNGDEKQLPDLWKNVARYTVNHSDYSKLLYETGLHDKLSSLVQESQ